MPGTCTLRAIAPVHQAHLTETVGENWSCYCQNMLKYGKIADRVELEHLELRFCAHVQSWLYQMSQASNLRTGESDEVRVSLVTSWCGDEVDDFTTSRFVINFCSSMSPG